MTHPVDTPTAPLRHALLALLLIAPAPSVGIVVALTLGEGPLGTLLWATAKLWLFALPLLWHRLVDRQRWSWSPLRRGGLGAGLASGLVFATVIVAAYLALGRQWIDPRPLRETLTPLGLTEPGIYLAGAAYWILVNSVLEEYVYRWFIFTRCRQLVGSTAGAAALSAAIFVVHHAIAMASYFAAPITALACAGIFVGGTVWSWLYQRYGSIWVGYLSHAIVDVAVFGVGAALLFG